MTQERAVVMRVHIDKSRRNDQSFSFDLFPGFPANPSNPDDVSFSDCHISIKSRVPGTIHDPSMPDNDIIRLRESGIGGQKQDCGNASQNTAIHVSAIINEIGFERRDNSCMFATVP